MQSHTKKTTIIPIITILLLLIATNITILADDQINTTWNATINITETTGKTDYIYIGEAPDASDGPPADTYDMPKAPTSPPPYLRIWANDNLPTPYSQLLGDYRHYPDSDKQWNLTILWYPTNPTDASTNVTITWNPTEITQSEYTTIALHDTNNSPLTNMLQTTTYTFTCPPLIPQHYKITCTGTNHPPTIPTTPNGTTTGYHNIPYTYTTTSTDPENDPISYLYNWDDGTPPQWTLPYPLGQPCTQTHTWDTPGTYNLTINHHHAQPPTNLSHQPYSTT